MPDKIPSRDGSAKKPLADRVRHRVLAVNRALERRDGAAQPKVKRSGTKKATTASAELNGDGSNARELRALRSVFHDLGVTHRRYRQRTGETVAPALRTAAKAFRQEPSLTSLVPVAGFLEDLDLLEW
jgi:hypothetical protein